MITSPYKTLHLFLLLCLFFGWINYSDAQDKNPFSTLTGKQLLSLPGKSIHNSLVESLFNTKHLHYKKGSSEYGTELFFDANNDTYYDGVITENDMKTGIGYRIENDKLKEIILHNDYTDTDYNQIWHQYKYALPLKLTWNMSMKDIVTLLGKPYNYGDVLDEFHYPDKKIHFKFNGVDYLNSRILYIEIGSR
jgi:hypothetical protein